MNPIIFPMTDTHAGVGLQNIANISSKIAPIAVTTTTGTMLDISPNIVSIACCITLAASSFKGANIPLTALVT